MCYHTHSSPNELIDFAHTEGTLREGLGSILRKDCAITHIPLRMNRGILHFAANYIDSFGEECV